MPVINRKPILNKGQMYESMIRGDLGNSLMTWTSASSFLTSGYHGDFTLRHRHQVGHPLKFYKQPYSSAEETFRLAKEEFGVNIESDIVIQALEDILTNPVEIQGELCQLSHGINLRYSFSSGVLRHVMLDEKITEECYGVLAIYLLRQYVPASDFDDLMDLLDLYPGHVIEFATFKRPLGRFNRQTVIWEVRNY